MALSYRQFLRDLPGVVVPALPLSLRGIKHRQPSRWLIQFHYGEPWLHYEISRAQGQEGLELGFHCESRDQQLNRFMLDGFRHHLFEIKDRLGGGIEAEMWDKGWTKIYEVFPMETLSADYQGAVGVRLASIITCLHPIYTELRGQVARIDR